MVIDAAKMVTDARLLVAFVGDMLRHLATSLLYVASCYTQQSAWLRKRGQKLRKSPATHKAVYK